MELSRTTLVTGRECATAACKGGHCTIKDCPVGFGTDTEASPAGVGKTGTRQTSRAKTNLPAQTNLQNYPTASVLLRTPVGLETLSVQSEGTARALSSVVQNHTGVTRSDQLLMFNGKTLTPDMHVKLQDGDHLQMVLPLMGGAKKKPKGTRNAGSTTEKRELLFKEDGQEYGRVTQLLGNRRVNLECMDGVKRLGVIRGSMKRGSVNRVRTGDVVLVGLRDYQDDKCDVVHKYDSDEIHRLKQYGELDASFKLTDDGDKTGGMELEDDDGIDFNFSDGDIDDI